MTQIQRADRGLGLFFKDNGALREWKLPSFESQVAQNCESDRVENEETSRMLQHRLFDGRHSIAICQERNDVRKPIEFQVGFSRKIRAGEGNLLKLEQQNLPQNSSESEHKDQVQ